MTQLHQYNLLDFGDAKRYEQWGDFRLIRPDPTAINTPKEANWKADATYIGEKGKGEWQKKIEFPEHWLVDFDDLQLCVRLTPYKHTGVFPEQEQNWNWMRDMAKGRSLNILNLFAYTGGATVALAKDGHFVTHVDAARPSIGWAKENAQINRIADDRIRWIPDDAMTFAAKELKRGKRYDGILLDPPAYGHGSGGKTWRVERDLAPLLEICAQLLSDSPCFLVLNGYAQNDTPDSFHRLLTGILHQKSSYKDFTIDAQEVFLKTSEGRSLSTGIVARCAFN